MLIVQLVQRLFHSTHKHARYLYFALQKVFCLLEIVQVTM